MEVHSCTLIFFNAIHVCLLLNILYPYFNIQQTSTTNIYFAFHMLYVMSDIQCIDVEGISLTEISMFMYAHVNVSV